MHPAYPHPRWKLATLQPFRYHFLPRPNPPPPSTSKKKPPNGQSAMNAQWIELAGMITRALQPFPDAFAAFRSVVNEFYNRYRFGDPIGESLA